jgi:hypothetical protein
VTKCVVEWYLSGWFNTGLFVCLFLSYANLVHPIRALCGGCCVSLWARSGCQNGSFMETHSIILGSRAAARPLRPGSSLLPGGDILSCSKISDSEISKSSESCSSGLILYSQGAPSSVLHYSDCLDFYPRSFACSLSHAGRDSL